MAYPRMLFQGMGGDQVFLWAFQELRQRARILQYLQKSFARCCLARAFWESITQFFKVDFDTPYEEVCVQATPFWKTKWFTGAQLSYAHHVFRNAMLKQNYKNKLQEDLIIKTTGANS